MVECSRAVLSIMRPPVPLKVSGLFCQTKKCADATGSRMAASQKEDNRNNSRLLTARGRVPIPSAVGLPLVAVVIQYHRESVLAFGDGR